MPLVYLDTNIFLYATESKSIFNQECLELIRFCQKNQIRVVTSAETIQEIIHLSINTKKRRQGIKTANIALKVVDYLYPVDRFTIEIYLEQAKHHLTSASRDLLHLSTCLANNINTLITYDSDFQKFKQLKILKPLEFLDLK